MHAVDRLADQFVLRRGSHETNRISLYDQHGAVAYGVILQMLPQPQQAQEVLLDLFASPEIQAAINASTNATCTVVRLARVKALDYQRQKQAPMPALPASTRQNELIFRLLFYQNQSVESVADRFQMQRSAVFGAVRDFFAHILPS